MNIKSKAEQLQRTTFAKSVEAEKSFPFIPVGATLAKCRVFLLHNLKNFITTFRIHSSKYTARKRLKEATKAIIQSKLLFASETDNSGAQKTILLKESLIRFP